MRGIILAIIYLLEILKYQMGYFMVFSKRSVKKWIFLIVGIPFFIEAFWDNLGEDGIYVLMYLCVVIGMFLVIQEKVSVRIMQLFTLCFILTCMDGLFGNLVTLFESGQGQGIYSGDFQYLAASLMTGGSLLIVLFLKSRLHKEYYKKFLCLARKGMQPLVAVMALSMLFTIAGLSYAKDQIEYIISRKTNFKIQGWNPG